jgi:hypothetical protein
MSRAPLLAQLEAELDQMTDDDGWTMYFIRDWENGQDIPLDEDELIVVYFAAPATNWDEN